MEIQHLLKPFEIEYLEADECPCKPHKHTFFEMVFIKKGKGLVFVDNNRYPYGKNDLFIIVPNDGHHTIVSERTGFLFIRFNKIYFNDGHSHHPSHSALTNWAKRLEIVFANKRLSHAMAESRYRHLMLALFDTLTEEHLGGGSNDVLHQDLINAILAIVGSYQPGKSESKADEGLPLLHYIHQNIYDPHKIKASSMAEHFCVSKTYISEYFRKHTGASMQEYILQYKVALVEIRLKHSDMRLSEIAFELGFTDESHLSRTFKKIKNISPSEYRKASL